MASSRSIPTEWVSTIIRELFSVGFDAGDISQVTGIPSTRVTEGVNQFGGIQAFPARPKDRYDILLQFVKSAGENFSTVHVEDPELREQIIRYRALLMVEVLELDKFIPLPLPVTVPKEDLVKILQKLPELAKLQQEVLKGFLTYQDSMKGPLESLKKFMDDFMK